MGNVIAQKLIIVGEKAEIKGDLSSKNIIVFGKLIGNVTATEVQIKKQEPFMVIFPCKP